MGCRWLIISLGDGADGDGTGERAAPITTMDIRAVGQILIVHHAPITNGDRLHGPTGQATAAIGVIARPHYRPASRPGPGRPGNRPGGHHPAPSVQARHTAPTWKPGPVKPAPPNQTPGQPGKPGGPDREVRTGQDPVGQQRPTKPSQRVRIEPQSNPTNLALRIGKGPADRQPRTSPNWRLRIALNRSRSRLRKRNPNRNQKLNLRNNRSIPNHQIFAFLLFRRGQLSFGMALSSATV